MRARLIDGRSKRSEDSRLKGSVSMRRKASWALRIALSPSHGVEPWAAVPETCEAQREHALGLDADVQIGRLAGEREVGAQALLDERRRSSAASTSSDSSSGTQTKRTRTWSCAATSLSAHIMAASAPFMS